MLTISEIKTNFSKVFARQTEQQKDENLAMLHYIEHLASQVSTNISTWDIGALFHDPKNTKKSLEIIKDKNILNKIFFEECDKLKTSPSIEMENMKKTIESGVKKYIEETIKRKKTDLEGSIRNNFANINNRILDIETLTARNVIHRRDLNLLTNVNETANVVAGIEQICNSNFFEFSETNNNEISFITRDNVTNSFKNELAGIDIKVNLGKFKVIFNFGNGVLKVLKHKDNLDYSGYYHPHVNANGNICWGNAMATVSEKTSKMELPEVFSILATILTNYNERNPYVNLVDFKKKEEERQKAKTVAKDQVLNASTAEIARMAQDTWGTTGTTTSGTSITFSQPTVRLTNLVNDENTAEF